MPAYFRNSNTPFTAYDQFMHTISFMPRFLINDMVPNSTEGFELIQDVPSFLRRFRRIAIERSHSLGDILLLLPVVRQLREQMGFHYVSLITQPRYVNNIILDTLGAGVFDEWLTKKDVLDGSSVYQAGVSLDGILERDHNDPTYQTIPRTTALMKWFGLEGEVSWDCGREWKKKDHIVLQTKGSTKVKSLPYTTREYLAERLSGEGFRVVLLDDNKRVSDASFFNLIATARCVVTMDSGPLWITYYTKTPCVLILGATRKEERLSMHPLYPEQATAVALNDELDCLSCFEQRKTCEGRVDCMALPKEIVADRVLAAIRRVL